VIYQIPQRSASLTHVLHPGEATAVQPSGLATDADVVRYIAAIEDPARPEARCEWSDAGNARIQARLSRGDAISVQTAYVRGWKATVSGESRRVPADGIGFNECEGDCEIDLRWTGPADIYLAALVSIIGLAITGLLLCR
jgi:hypothetical protein